MTHRAFLFEPRDPLIFRDGRPFGAGLSAWTLPWAVPSVTIGWFRTELGRETGYGEPHLSRLLEARQIGPFLAVAGEGGWELAFPAPFDVAAYDVDDDPGRIELLALNPANLNHDEGTDLNEKPASAHRLEGLQPLFGARNRKASQRNPAFWKAEFAISWLARRNGQPMRYKPLEIGVDRLPRQRRVHVAIERGTQAAAEEMLFTTEGLEFALPQERGGQRLAIYAELAADGIQWPGVGRTATLGGERRLAYVTECDSLLPPAPKIESPPDRIRLQLVTPGVFRDGWRPGWIGPTGEGEFPLPLGEPVRLRLLAAAVGRGLPYSGWDLALPGPKEARLLAPAGSVYFFQVLSGDARRLWLASMCDEDQPRRDGFGLVVLGVW